LVAGAKVTPHLVTSRVAAPAVGPVDGLDTPIASEHDWPGVEATLGPVPAAQSALKPAPPRPLSIRSTAYAPAARGADAVVTVTVTNPNPRPVTFRLRPETVAFDVTGPSGVSVTDPSPTVKCAGQTGERRAPIAEVYETLRSGQQA